MPTTLQPIVVHCGAQQNFDVPGFTAARGLVIVAYIDHYGSGAQRAAIDGVPALTFVEWRRRLCDIPSIVSAMDPAERRALTERISKAGGVFLTGRPSDQAVSPSVIFGEGIISGVGPLFIASLTTVGRHVVLVTPASIGHDCVIGDFVTIHPSVAISGYVIIGDGVVIGVGAVIVNGTAAKPLRIGPGTQIAPGAVVTKSAGPAALILGNPGRPQRPPIRRP